MRRMSERHMTDDSMRKRPQSPHRRQACAMHTQYRPAHIRHGTGVPCTVIEVGSERGWTKTKSPSCVRTNSHGILGESVPAVLCARWTTSRAPETMAARNGSGGGQAEGQSCVVTHMAHCR